MKWKQKKMGRRIKSYEFGIDDIKLSDVFAQFPDQTACFVNMRDLSEGVLYSKKTVWLSRAMSTELKQPLTNGSY